MKTIMPTIYSLAIGSLFLTASPASAQDDATGASEATPPPKLAPGSKSVKKKIVKAKNALSEAVPGEDGAAVGVGASKQEPKPGKYSAEVEFQFGYTSGSGSSKPSSEYLVESKSATSNMSLATTYQFIFGKFGVGPILQYSSSTTKMTADGKTQTDTLTSTDLGLAAEYFIFDVQTEKLVPFVAFKYLMTSGSNSKKSAEGDETKTTTSGNQMGLGGGVKYFLARHVSIDPALWYISTSYTDKLTDSSTKISSTDIQLVASLSTYF